jgi:hypothetical protein
MSDREEYPDNGPTDPWETSGPWDRRADDILRVEALTSWCRRHIEPPPADILYGAVNAIERLKQEARDAE